MADENGAASSIAQEVTAADVDLSFLQHEQNTLAALRGDQPKPAEAKPNAEPAPAGEPTTVAVAEPPKVEPKPLTAEDLKALETKFNQRFEEVKPKEQPKEDPAPDLADQKYANFQDWLKDYNEWQGRQTSAAVAKALTERDTQAAERTAQEAQVTKLRTDWETRETAFKASAPDYDSLRAKVNDWPVNPEAIKIILNSEVGPAMWHKIASGTKEQWERLIGLDEVSMKVQLRLMEHDLQRTAAPVASTVTMPAPKAAPAAPPPPKVLGGRQTAPTDDAAAALERDDFPAYEAHTLETLRRDRQGRFATR